MEKNESWKRLSFLGGQPKNNAGHRKASPVCPLTAEVWNPELAFAEEMANDQPADFPQAQTSIMETIRIDMETGRV
jgi:hypothetical protein